MNQSLRGETPATNSPYQFSLLCHYLSVCTGSTGPFIVDLLSVSLSDRAVYTAEAI
jgi:hypothetical protein